MTSAAGKFLEGIRVLDLTRVLAGPYATMILADLGAEVIKVESLEGDDTRRVGPPFVAGVSAYFLSVNRGKKSVAVDLSRPQGRAVLEALAKKCDVMIDNFRPGVLERLGIAHARMSEVNPRLVLCSITSFGNEGPMRDLPAFDLVIQAWSGAMSVTGESGRPPARLGIPLGDLGGGLHAAIAIAAALYRREKTGKGQSVDLSLLDCLVSMQTYLAQYHWADGRVPGPQGSGHESTVPYGAFRTRDGWIALGVFTERFWKPFCEALGRPEWAADPLFATNAERLKRRAALEEMLTIEFLKRDTDVWLQKLLVAGVPAAPVLSLDETLALEQLTLRKMKAAFDHPEAGRVPTIASPIARGAVRPAPLLGEHTREVLSGVAGLAPEEIASLAAARAVFCR